jgi:hypothetical protein
MKNIFYFGEQKDEFPVRVLNERELRAGAGILFAFAMIALMNVILLGNFYVIKLFIIIFILDFIIRIFINPKFAPSLIVGRMAVSKQKPEYVGAPQKRFAWSLGLILALFMFFVTVLGTAPLVLSCLVCLVCLVLLFFESAFGICVGCKIYNLFNKEKAKLCPGGVCEILKKEEIQKVSVTQIFIALIFVSFTAWLTITGGFFLKNNKSINSSVMSDCMLSNSPDSPCLSAPRNLIKSKSNP